MANNELLTTGGVLLCPWSWSTSDDSLIIAIAKGGCSNISTFSMISWTFCRDSLVAITMVQLFGKVISSTNRLLPKDKESWGSDNGSANLRINKMINKIQDKTFSYPKLMKVQTSGKVPCSPEEIHPTMLLILFSIFSTLNLKIFL